MKRGIFLGLLYGALCLASAEAAPIPVMILDGESAGAYHNWRLTSRILKTELEETGLFIVTVVTAPPSGGDFSSFAPDFTKYRVVVSNLDSPDWPLALRQKFEVYMKSGGGFVSIHAADNAFPGWPAYNQMDGVGGWRQRNEASGPMWHYENGALKADPTPGPAGSHGARIPFSVTTRVPSHPIMRGLPSSWMHMDDELYAHLRGPGGMTVLATAFSDPANKGSGHDEPILMVSQFGKGRVFHTTLGHDATALSCVGFITTFQRGVEWTATGKVSQKVPQTFPSARTVSSRVDIAAMETSAPQ